MKWDDPDHVSPCSSCPYRRDAKLGFWAEAEFTKLHQNLGDAGNVKGSVYGCHADGKKPDDEVRPCIGWMLDQKRRGVESIPLRIALIMSKAAEDLFERISDAGLDLYESAEEMIRENLRAIRTRRRRRGL